jgi:hypothetical protein
MPIIEDYLRAVAVLLPKAQREDIVAELRDIILTRIEGREAELSRALTPDETEAVLREVGHPVVVAARYRGGPQHAIGPALYPYWWFGVKAAVALQLAVALLAFLLRSLAGGDIAQAFGHAMGAAIDGSLALIGFATLAAWIVERKGLRIDYLDRWRVRDLRFLQFASLDLDAIGARIASSSAWKTRPAQPWSLRAGKRQSPAARGLGLIAGGAVLTLWWTGMLHFVVIGNLADLRDLGMEPGPLMAMDWASLRAAIFWPVLAYAVMLMLQGAGLIAWPDRTRLHGLWDIAIGATVLATTAWLWTASSLAAATEVDSVAAFARLMKTTLDHGLPFPLGAVLTFCLAANAFGAVCRIARGLWQLLLPTPSANGDTVGASAGRA